MGGKYTLEPKSTQTRRDVPTVSPETDEPNREICSLKLLDRFNLGHSTR
jgi:hypothetical protein